jgi:hypothetical protein
MWFQVGCAVFDVVVRRECIVLVGGLVRFFSGGPYIPYIPCSWQCDFHHKGHTGLYECVLCEGIHSLSGHQHILHTEVWDGKSSLHAYSADNWHIVRYFESVGAVRTEFSIVVRIQRCRCPCCLVNYSCTYLQVSAMKRPDFVDVRKFCKCVFRC